MTQPHFEPQPDNSFRIVYPAPFYASSGILKRIRAGEMPPAEAQVHLAEIVKKYPWHFEAALLLSDRYTLEGDFEKACNVRFKACQRLADLLPEDENDPLLLDFEHRDNQTLLLLLYRSAIDHFLIGEFELAAALLETLTDLDEEDHLNGMPILAYCYVALEEQESFEAVELDLDDKSADTAIVRLWAEWQFGGSLKPASVADFRQQFPEVYREFTAAMHDVTETYLSDIDSEHPSKEARARLIWLQTEHLWLKTPEFIAALNQ